jgi:hypothetical protein
MWGAIGEGIKRQLLPGRALAALKSFRELIEDGRAMLAGKYIERLDESSGGSSAPARTTDGISSMGTDFDPSNFSFDFGANAKAELSEAFERHKSPSPRLATQMPVPGQVPLTIASRGESRVNRISKLQKEIEGQKDEVSRLRLGGWQLLGILHHQGGQTTCHDMFGVRVPEDLREAPPNCDHCHFKRKRNDTFVLQSDGGKIQQVGRTCLKKFLPGEDFTQYKRLSDRLMELTDELERSKTLGAPEAPPISIQASDVGEKGLASHAESSGWDNSQYAEEDDEADDYRSRPRQYGFASEPSGTIVSILKFLIDRTGYIKQLEEEDTPEAYSRIENLRELVNAAMDSRDRGETLDQFLDHAALVSDADQYDEHAQITLMTLHAAKGLEFPLVVLAGMEEGLFPHSRTMLEPDSIEEERRLCYVGMTRAMDTLILSRAVYRRRYGTDMPEASVPSRFLEEVPPKLVEELGGSRASRPRPHDRVGTVALARPAGRGPAAADSTHYSYEDEDQSATWNPARVKPKTATPLANYNSIDNIAEFFASRGKKFHVPKLMAEEPKGRRGFRPGQKVKHPKYGEGTVYQREGDGEDAKITVQFPRFGLKKLVERYAQLEKA